MDPATAQMIVSISGLVVRYGVGAVTAAMVTLDKDTITQADIDALPKMIKMPDKY